jgi:effector protein SdbA
LTDGSNIKITNRETHAPGLSLIDFCEIETLNNKTSAKNQKIIIHAVGNGDCYEHHMDEYIAVAKKFPNYRIIGFNFRGTLRSIGRNSSEDNFISDPIAIVRYLKVRGIQPQNILFNGHSLGGALLTLAAAKMYQDDLNQAHKAGKDLKKVKSVKLINNRSFANLTDEILATFIPQKGSALIAGMIYGTLLCLLLGSILSMLSAIAATSIALVGASFISEKISQTLLRPWLKGLLWLTFGTLDAASAYKSLPEDCVDHIVAKRDGVIKEHAGIHHALRPINKAKKAALREIITQSKDSKTKAAAMHELRHLKDSKVTAIDTGTDGNTIHNASLDMLFTYHKLRHHKDNDHLPTQISAEKVMEQKITRLFKTKAL